MTLDLSTRERKVFSQNGEDGIIAAIFETIGTTNRRSLEFGAHPDECNTRLLSDQGWGALCWDVGVYDAPWFAQELVTPGNISDLFAQYHLPDELDFLSIDVDGNDFHLWHLMAPRLRPRVVCLEHNSALTGFLDMVVPIHAVFQWDGTNYFGASLMAMTQLGRKRGYTLVYVEQQGVNAFFVRDDCLTPGMFAHQGNVAALYRPPAYGDGGHPPDPFNRPYQASWEYLRFGWAPRGPTP